MALIKYQYSNDEERENIIASNTHLFLCEQQILFDGNYLVFSENPLEVLEVYTNVPEEEFNRLKSENQSLNNAIVELYEIVLGGI